MAVLLFQSCPKGREGKEFAILDIFIGRDQA
jgi:hypothetical protein